MGANAMDSNVYPPDGYHESLIPNVTSLRGEAFM